MTGVVFATMDEARAAIARLDAREAADAPDGIYRFGPSPRIPSGVLIIGGIGPAQTAEAVERLITEQNATTIINVGICGALRNNIRPGDLFRIEEVVDGDAILRGDSPASPLHPDFTAAEEGAPRASPPKRLATVTTPVFDEQRREKLAQCADLVDMEGIAVADVCRRHGARFCLLKGVSDDAGTSGKADLRENIAFVSDKLAEFLLVELTREREAAD